MKTEKQKEALLKVNQNKRLTTKEWIEKAKAVHGDKYDYSITMYTTAKTKLKVVCPLHGEQEMLPHHHIQGHGCGKCGKEQINKTSGKQLTQEQFISRVSSIEGLSFEKTIYKSKRDSIIVTCKEHGDYETKAEMLLKGCGCPKCWGSKGEKIIENWLIKSNIQFMTQATFEGCVNIRRLKFDFFIPSKNLCIEYDGKQHFTEVEYWGGKEGLENRQLNDQIKTEFCKQKQINLLRLSYKDNIEEELNKFYIFN